MARVVERRKNIPWALIVFVFLFLVAATLAVLWRIDLDERTLAVADGKEKLDIYTRMSPQPAEEPARSVWKRQKDGLAPLETEAHKANGRGVIQQLMDREQPLIDVIAGLGSGLTPELAAAKGRDVLDPRAGGDRSIGLTKIIETMGNDLNADKDKIHALEQARDAAALEVKGLGEKIELAKAAHDKEIGDLKGQLATVTADKGKVDQTHQGELAKIKKEYEDRIEKLNADSNRFQGDVEKLKGDLRKALQGKTIAEKKLAVYEKAKKRSMAFLACGRVVQTKIEDGIVYVNLGEKDRVVPGLTFAVYPSEHGMPQVVKDDGTVTEASKLKGKAQLYVVQVMERVSMCRIEWLGDAGDPVIKGDLVGNLAFDPVRTFRFTVIGDFDLYSSGKPQEADADHIRFLIRRFRGEVSKDIDDQTDFLIVGTKPAETAPVEGAEDTPQAVKARQEKEKRRAEYERIRTLAGTRDVPILNANEFLALVGYTPQNSLKTFGPEGR